MRYLGDFLRGDIVDVPWASTNSLGASAAPSSNGTVIVFQGNSSSASTQVGVTDTVGFASITGNNLVRISTASATGFFLPGFNYTVVRSGTTIDGQLVNSPIGAFSIEYRYETGLIRRGTLAGGDGVSVTLDASASAVSDFYNGGFMSISDNTGSLQGRGVVDYAGATKVVTVDRAFSSSATPGNGSTFKLYEGSLPSQDSELADAFLGRNIGGGSSTGRTVTQALYAVRNRVDATSSVVTVYQTDDATSSWTGSITTGSGGIASVDPA